MDDAIAVIDIGMTNKKVAVYDSALRQLNAEYRNFPPILVDGLETHDLAAMEAWFLEQLSAAAKKWPIRSIAVTTHGATFVCVGADGTPCVPCVYYTHEPGDLFHRRFYEEFGDPVSLQKQTGTPYLKALINTAKGVFFARERFPGAFAKTTGLLFYPQYWGFRLTGKAGAEGTYSGCHTYLWDQVEGRLSTVAKGLGVEPLMPPKLSKSWDTLGTITAEVAAKTGLPQDTIVTMGIHDSNASLLPHFAKRGERTDGKGFVLNSTGTWCVIMKAVTEYAFRPEELGKVVFFNISAFGTPVKTAIFLGGQEFETWSNVLMAIHGRDGLPPYEPELYRSILREKRAFLLPELTAGSGQFPHSRPRVVEDGTEYPFDRIAASRLQAAPREGLPLAFKNYERGIALLRISLVMQTLTALERAGLDAGEDVFTEGGFRKNEAYNALLAAALKGNGVFLTDIPEATALGAAMTAKMAFSGGGLWALAKDFAIEYHEVAKADIPELFAYRQAWLTYTE